ncbi:hypothetical protein CesoFtcFv8_024784 [Champsocephalus esox]|uniref:Uncharacterized protein n=1 Tax=Champsocephalus esox TaxID=159716 RepID=A0AAN8B376_9TELE|nr:hypothetical protein CesoFtcFv8_024784 [Champsocephalus esox]
MSASVIDSKPQPCGFGCPRTSEWPDLRYFGTNMWSHFHPMRVHLRAAYRPDTPHCSTQTPNLSPEDAHP